MAVLGATKGEVKVEHFVVAAWVLHYPTLLGMRAKAASTANVIVRWLVRGSTPSGDSLSLLKSIDPVWSVPVCVEAPVEAKRAAGRLDVRSQFDHQFLSA